jgi:hypothetical protein
MTATNIAKLNTAWMRARSAQAQIQMRLFPHWDKQEQAYKPSAAQLIREYGEACKARCDAYAAYVSALQDSDPEAQIPIDFEPLGGLDETPE